MFGSKKLQQGDRVKLKDGREAEFRFYDISPYPAEEREGIQRAFVWGEHQELGTWSDYITLSEIKGFVRR